MGLQGFGRMDDSESSACRRDAGELFTPYVLRSIAVSPQIGWFENGMPSTTARGHLSNGVNGCQGTPCSEELGVKELRGALGGECGLGPRGSAVSWTSSTWSTHPSTSTTVWHYADFKGVV